MDDNSVRGDSNVKTPGEIIPVSASPSTPTKKKPPKRSRAPSLTKKQKRTIGFWKFFGTKPEKIAKRLGIDKARVYRFLRTK